MTRRLLISYLGLTLLILASLEVPLALSYRDRLSNELTADLIRDAFAVGGYAEDTLEGNGSADLGALAASYADRTGARIIIVDADGRVRADSQPDIGSSDFSSRPEIATALAGEVATGTRHSDTLGTDLLFAAVPIASGGHVHGAIRITYSTDQIAQRQWRYNLTLLAVAAVCATTAILLGVLFARWVSRPMAELGAAAEQLGAGELGVRASIDDGPPEVRQLAAEFNAMATEIDELVQAQQAFVADASHQLRSPLAALRLRLENLQSDLDGESEEAHADLEAALTETLRLSRIIDGLLALARADRTSHASDAIRPTRIEVDTAFRDRAVAWRPYATDHGVELRVDASELAVLAGEDRLTQVLDNLIANALAATAGRPGAQVELCAQATEFADEPDRSTGGFVNLRVRDNGPGMTEEQRARAFDRFWQRPQAAAGSGLGLAIARKLISLDGGEISLSQRDPTGIDVIIRLPAPA